MPVLAVYAEKSQLGNREAAQKVFPKIESTEIPGTGHFLMMEKPQEFNRLLTAFLQRVTF
jgi:sigma-B regulation protein RsbQ